MHSFKTYFSSPSVSYINAPTTYVTWHEKIGLCTQITPLHIILIISLSVTAIQVLSIALNSPLFAELIPKV